MSLVAVINGVFGVVQAVKAVGDVINQLGALPSSAGQGSPSKGSMACCANPNAIPQKIIHKAQLKRALAQLKNQVFESDAVDHHEAFEIDPLIDVLQSITQMSQEKVNDDSVEHDQRAHERLRGHVSVVSELFKHLKGKAEDDDDRNAPLSKILDLLIQAVDGEQTHSNVLDLVQAHHADLDDFKGLFQDLLTSSEPSFDSALTEDVSEESAVESPRAEDSEEGALNALFNVRTLDQDVLKDFLKEFQARQKDSVENEMPTESFEKLMKDVQKVLISFDPKEAASVDTLLDSQFAHLSLGDSAARTIQRVTRGWLARLARNARKAAITMMQALFRENATRGALPPEVKSDASDRAFAELPNAALEDATAQESDATVEVRSNDKFGSNDAPLREDVQGLIESLRGAFQRSSVRHVVLVILSALATAPAVQPYWAFLLSMITTSSQMQMLPYGIGALALMGVILLARHHFEAQALILSSPDEKSFFTPKTTDNIQTLHRRNGWLQIGLGALFLGVAGYAVYVQWPLIASVFVSSSLLVQGLMVALPALLMVAAVYFGVQDFKHHGEINNLLKSIPSNHTETVLNTSRPFIAAPSAAPPAAPSAAVREAENLSAAHP